MDEIDDKLRESLKKNTKREKAYYIGIDEENKTGNDTLSEYYIHVYYTILMKKGMNTSFKVSLQNNFPSEEEIGMLKMTLKVLKSHLKFLRKESRKKERTINSNGENEDG